MDPSVFKTLNLSEITLWSATALASVVGLLTLYNAAKLKTGILAVATYAFGAGMFCLAGGLLLRTILNSQNAGSADLVFNSLFFVGFALLGYGSYRIYQMSKI